jgi:hypothetical protein
VLPVLLYCQKALMHMNLYPRQHTPHVRTLLGRSLHLLRHTLEFSSSGFGQDGLLSTARDFNNNTTKHKPVNRLAAKWLHRLAWLAGAALAAVYLMWFFKNIFDHTVR